LILDTELPMVSVGIPTFNRPFGLKRTLENITSQKYLNLEIIVSDNCSPNGDTEAIVKHFMQNDSRVFYYKQPTNIGAWENFLFVLEKAQGEYFMWAADDDEWEDNFVTQCLCNMSGVGSVMCEFETVFRNHKTIIKNKIPHLGYSGSTHTDVSSFLKCMQPTLIYGLHRRSNIQFALYEDGFDFYDCYFVLKLILENGLRTIPGVNYRAGVDEIEYRVKTMDIVSGQLNYFPFTSSVIKIIWTSRKLTYGQKANLSILFLRIVLGLIIHHKQYNKTINFIIRTQNFFKRKI